MSRPFPFSEVSSDLIRLALLEDLAFGDVTSDAIFTTDDETSALFVAKEPIVVAGIPVVDQVMRRVDPEAKITWTVDDGDAIAEGVFGEIEGRVRSILRAERVMLNFMRHLSGIATLTRRCVEALGRGGARLVDTRKTTPGFRELEKYAVRIAGGHNHRYNLGAGAMIKDNHIAAAGSIRSAVEAVRDHAPFLTRVEVEVTNFGELDDAIAAGADAVLLDNMSNEDMRRAVELVDGRAIVEASGNITEHRLPELAPLGLDIISVGALTHSAPNVDISLRLDPNR